MKHHSPVVKVCMRIPNAYCKKHDEIEAQDNEGFWVCPECSKENMKKLIKPNKDGVKPLDAALAKIEKNFGRNNG